MICKFAKITDKPWFLQRPDGVKTVRCYYPSPWKNKVAGGLLRLAIKGDTFDISKPVKDQIILDADYVCVRSCVCGPKRCKYYQEREE